MGSLHPPTPIGWRVNGVGIQSNAVLSYYQVFPDNRADIQGWIRVVWRVGWGVGWCDDSMEESAIAIPDCIPALDSRDSTARIVRIGYPQTFVPSVIRLAVQTQTLQTAT